MTLSTSGFSHMSQWNSKFRQRSTLFFTVMSGTMIVLALVGFGPTFYFRWWYGNPALPSILVVHGFILSVWFIGLALQSLFIASGRTAWHRELGVMMVGLTVAVIFSSAIVVLEQIPRAEKSGLDVQNNILYYSRMLWGNISLLVKFSFFFTAAVLLRQKPDFHKRLIFLAAISLIAPAIAHIFGAGNPIIVLAVLLLTLSLVAYDLLSIRRVHKVTAIGGIAFFVIAGIFRMGIGSTEFAQQITLNLL